MAARMDTVNDKRSAFPCPMIISGRSRSTSQARESQRISETFEQKLARETSPKARRINDRNNAYLADKRRKMTKSIRMPS